MPDTIIGRVSIVPKGTWSSVLSYHRLDAVNYSGSSYLALGDVPPGVLPTSTAYWMELAHKGDTGAGAGFGSTSATIAKLQPNQQPTVSVSATGPATQRNISFNFGVPQGVKGDTGNGIDSVALGEDYKLTINFTDGNSITVGPIRGETGNGIDHIALGADYRLNIYYTDGTSTTTDPIRGATGAAAGFGMISATAETVDPDEEPTVSVTATGPDTAKNIAFAFEIPKGDPGEVTEAELEAALAVKADKVSGATAGHLATLDGNGNLADSGVRAAAIPEAERRLDVIYKLAKGQVYDTQTDAQAAYQKIVPSGAVAAAVASIGGKTVELDGTLLSAPVLAVEAVGYNMFDKSNYNGINGYFNLTAPIAASLNRKIVYFPAEPNTAYAATRLAVLENDRFYIGYTKEKPEIGVDVFDVSYAPSSQTVGSRMTISTTTGADAKYLVVWAYWNGEASALDTLCVNRSQPDTSVSPHNGESVPYHKETLEIPAAVRALEGYGESPVGGDGNTLNLADGTYTEIGHYVDGVWTALAEPVVTDVSALLPDNMLGVEAGGTLTFVQDGTALMVPNSVEYLIKLSEVTE